MLRSTLILVALFVTACSGPPVDPERDAGAQDAGATDSGVQDAGTKDGGGEVDGGICPSVTTETTTDGHLVTVCLTAFAEPPYVHLPPDVTDGNTAFVYGGVDRNDADQAFATRTQRLQLTFPVADWLVEEMTDSTEAPGPSACAQLGATPGTAGPVGVRQ